MPSLFLIGYHRNIYDFVGISSKYGIPIYISSGLIDEIYPGSSGSHRNLIEIYRNSSESHRDISSFSSETHRIIQSNEMRERERDSMIYTISAFPLRNTTLSCKYHHFYTRNRDQTRSGGARRGFRWTLRLNKRRIEDIHTIHAADTMSIHRSSGLLRLQLEEWPNATAQLDCARCTHHTYLAWRGCTHTHSHTIHAAGHEDSHAPQATTRGMTECNHSNESTHSAHTYLAWRSARFALAHHTCSWKWGAACMVCISSVLLSFMWSD